MNQPTAFQQPLATVEARLTDHHLSLVEDALAILGPSPSDEDVRHHFRNVPRAAVRGRLKRVFWARVASAPTLQRAKTPAPFMVRSEAMSPVGYPCVYCGAPAQAIDHVWPRSRGGDDHPNNLVRACTGCNASKSNKSILDDVCPDCGHRRTPGDVDTATGTASYVCRCGPTWTRVWDLQAVPFNA